MDTGEIFAAAERLHKGAALLHSSVQTVLPEIEEALHRDDEHPGGAATRQAFALSRLEEIADPTREVLLAFDQLLRALGGGPLILRDQGTPLTLPSPPADGGEARVRGPGGRGLRTGINFERFAKLKELFVVEKTIEVMAPLRGERPVLMRLEALRSPNALGYEIAVYRQETVSVPNPAAEAGAAVGPQRDGHSWVAYDVIRSDGPTADMALEQALGFLEMRCV